MARTVSPTRAAIESPSRTVGRPWTSWIWMSARSCAASVPTTVAAKTSVCPNKVTVTVVASEITWSLVSTSPSGVMTIPVPTPCTVVLSRPVPCVSIATTAGSTSARTSWTSAGLASADPLGKNFSTIVFSERLATA